jgi:hypothetical protein
VPFVTEGGTQRHKPTVPRMSKNVNVYAVFDGQQMRAKCGLLC